MEIKIDFDLTFLKICENNNELRKIETQVKNNNNVVVDVSGIGNIDYCGLGFLINLKNFNKNVIIKELRY